VVVYVCVCGYDDFFLIYCVYTYMDACMAACMYVCVYLVWMCVYACMYAYEYGCMLKSDVQFAYTYTQFISHMIVNIIFASSEYLSSVYTSEWSESYIILDLYCMDGWTDEWVQWVTEWAYMSLFLINDYFKVLALVQ